jgi:mRNA interferase RelE/StbE
MYKLEIEESALKEISKLDKHIQIFMMNCVEEIEKNYFEFKKINKIEPLKHDLKGFYKYKAQTFRIILKEYEEKLLVVVVSVGYRREVYKNLKNKNL